MEWCSQLAQHEYKFVFLLVPWHVHVDGPSSFLDVFTVPAICSAQNASGIASSFSQNPCPQWNLDHGLQLAPLKPPWILLYCYCPWYSHAALILSKLFQPKLNIFYGRLWYFSFFFDVTQHRKHSYQSVFFCFFYIDIILSLLSPIFIRHLERTLEWLIWWLIK